MKKKSILLFIILITISGISGAQQFVTSTIAYDKVQNTRAQARHLYNKDNASVDDIKRGIVILNNAITYLDSLPVVELAQGNPYLKARKLDIPEPLTTSFRNSRNIVPKHFDHANTLMH
ncbi:hypothetical protein [Mucilaginibacter sp.]